jgi:hypothetical protein
MIGGLISGLGTNGAAGPNQLALISLGVVLFVLGGGVLLFGGRLRPVPVARSTGDAEQERLELVVRLAALDERFASGEVSRTAYQTERESGKRRLRELTLARRDAVSSGV